MDSVTDLFEQLSFAQTAIEENNYDEAKHYIETLFNRLNTISEQQWSQNRGALEEVAETLTALTGAVVDEREKVKQELSKLYRNNNKLNAYKSHM
ncbi:hypothetical protein [Pseudoalteromonas aurantia]|uniref:Flagellar protein FliT n=1 Tax=Pseudoalteromonas aurantia TaxID=43654 RepID=A0A5S3VD02_9GAMM|nr:hypothetical protein [Pseudoalteromonas aurantia]TMO69479.1 hypothetical protein CWC19_04740 [Pseudoalteromonas aurantia]